MLNIPISTTSYLNQTVLCIQEVITVVRSIYSIYIHIYIYIYIYICMYVCIYNIHNEAFKIQLYFRFLQI